MSYQIKRNIKIALDMLPEGIAKACRERNYFVSLTEDDGILYPLVDLTQKSTSETDRHFKIAQKALGRFQEYDGGRGIIIQNDSSQCVTQ
jgi:hypothetical protein